MSEPHGYVSRQDLSGGQLFERETGLRAFGDALDGASSGRGGWLALLGEPGSGRSSLLVELRRDAAARRFAVLAATGSEAERHFTFGVARQLLEEVIVRAAADRREDVLQGAAETAAPLLSATPGAQSEGPGFEALNGLFRLVASLAEREPVLLSVDDVDLADDESLELLGYVKRRLERMRVVVAVSATERTAAARSSALDSVLSGSNVTTLPVTNLTAAGIGQLLSQALGREPAAEFARECHRATGGNPRLIVELAAHLRAQGVEPHAAGAEGVQELTPSEIVRRVAGKLGVLQEPERALAHAVAVLGGEADPRDAAQLASLDDRAAREAIDALARADLLRAGTRLEMRYPIYGAALIAEMPPAEHAAYRLTAARLRADRNADVAEVAGHLLRGPPRDDPWAVETLRTAAQRAVERGDPTSAVRLLRRALAEPPRQDERAAVLLELASAAVRVGESDAVRLMRDAFQLAAEPQARAQAALELAATLAFAGQSAAGVEVLERALDEMGDEGSELAIRLLGLLLVLVVTTTTARRRAAARLDEARRLVDSLEPRSMRVLLPSLAVEEATSGGSAEKAVELARRALGDGRLLAEHSADSPLPYLAVGALAWADRADVAERTLDAALTEARARASRRGVAMACAARAYIRLLAGKVDGVESDVASYSAEDAGADPAISVFSMLASASRICSLVECDRLDEAKGERERLDLIPHDPDALLVQPAREARARLALALGDADGALEQYAASRERQERWGAPDSPAPVDWRAGAALASIAAGRGADAQRLARDAVAIAQRFGAPRTVGVALRARGLASAKRHALADLEESANVLARSSDRLEHARSLVELGAALRRKGSRSEARKPLRSGMEIAITCGASELAARARHELRASGARGVPAAGAQAAQLTPSELRVARLAAAGRTNREIARELFVTVKTVEMHLSNAYRKLEISSRRELGTALPE